MHPILHRDCPRVRGRRRRVRCNIGTLRTQQKDKNTQQCVESK